MYTKEVMKNLSLPVESVRERDIDFLLVEEFLSSDSFITFFTQTLNLPHCDELIGVQRSINDFALGETDVLVEYISDGTRIGLLIENKLDAIFQPQQAERYTSRGKYYQSEGRFDTAYSILVAPTQYIERQSDFELHLSYEQIIQYFQTGDLGKRGEFKSTLLSIGSEKLRRGYVAVNSETNQAFWVDYSQQLASAIPTATIKPVSVVPAGSDWINFSIGAIKVIHKLSAGSLDLIGVDEATTATLENTFGNRVERVLFKSGATAVRLHTEVLDRTQNINSQSSQLSSALQDLKTLASLTVQKP